MKKLFQIIVLVCFYTVILFGCTKNIAVDSNTQGIDATNKRHIYQDGQYTAHASYFNDEGYAPILEICVTDGIITNIYYDLYSSNGTYFSMLTDEKFKSDIQSFNTELKSLNTQLLQSQTYLRPEVVSSSQLQANYTAMTSALIPKMLSGDHSSTKVALAQSYTATGSVMNEFGYYYKLSVKYYNDVITEIKFIQINEEGEDIIVPDQKLNDFYDQYNIDYLEFLDMIQSIPEDRLILQKVSPIELYDPLFEVYNELAAIIDAKRTEFIYDTQSLFSNK